MTRCISGRRRGGKPRARIVEIVSGDELAAIPIGSYRRAFGVTLSLPSIVGRHGIVSVLEPEFSEEERGALEKSTQTLRDALERVGLRGGNR